MLKVMLDTNILVKFAFIYYKEYKKKEIPSYLKKFKELLRLYEKAKFFNIMSNWNKLELRDVLMKLKIAEICFSNGFSVDEFKNAEEEGISLNEKEIKGVNQIVFDIWKFSQRETKDMNMRKIERLTKKGFSHMDMVLLYQAELNKCDYFVTEDKGLRFNKELKKEFDIKICCTNEIKEILKSTT
jgi:hypothetical protein